MAIAKKRILLVEDFEDSRFSLSKLLEIEGYSVIQAGDGAEAVTVAARELPDLILMDLSLPILDGMAATRELKADPRLESVPIIALSGHDASDLTDAESAGFTDYVTKPIDFDVLAAMLSKYLGR